VIRDKSLGRARLPIDFNAFAKGNDIHLVKDIGRSLCAPSRGFQRV
jgi:hypothetical protein